MSPHDFLLHVYCLVDDELRQLDFDPLRTRGPAPTLADSEVSAIEVAGEFWGLDCDRDLFRHFRSYHHAEFPALARINRTTFTRQAANLWRVKQLIQRRLADRLTAGDPVWLVDSLPVDACEFARATFCARFAGQADYGYCHLRKRTFYGFRLHLRCSRDGVIVAYQLASARVGEKAALLELDLLGGTVGIGDRNFWSPETSARLTAEGVTLLAPFQHKSRDPDPTRSSQLSAVRYRIETVNGQLAERYRVKRTWARDRWHLCHRLIRKILSHTVAICLGVRAGHPPLQFDALAA